MPWRDLLSPAHRAQVMALPTSLREYEELYSLTRADQEFVAVRRTNAGYRSATLLPAVSRSSVDTGGNDARLRCSEASVIDGVLKITPLDNRESDEAELPTRQAYGLMPRIKLTDLLTEVDGRCDFGRHFTNLRSGDAVADRPLLLTAIPTDGINLGLTRMADACPGVSLSTLSRIATWHIRDETYAKALAEIVNHRHRLEFAAHWGDGTTSSSDGQRFKSGGGGEAIGSVNARYGNEPGATFYTHISDQYAPFHIKLISAIVRDATHVLDDLLYHESALRIEEHYTDTAGLHRSRLRLVSFAWIPVCPPASVTLRTHAFTPWRSRPAIRRWHRSSAGS